MTSSAFNRGVPRSPNRHLDQFRIVGQVDVGGRKIQRNGFADIRSGFLLRVTGGRASAKFRADSRVTPRDRIKLQNDSESHNPSICWPVLCAAFASPSAENHAAEFVAQALGFFGVGGGAETARKVVECLFLQLARLDAFFQ